MIAPTHESRSRAPQASVRAGVATALVLVFGALALQAVRDRSYALASRDTASIYVRSVGAIGRAVLSFDALAADVYWMRTMQYYGGTRLSRTADKTYPLLHTLLDLTTSLDPQFSLAYRFGAIFLAEAPPDGPGRPDLSLALLRKGLAASPDRWQYAMDTGFVHYWWLQDYTTAAAWFERAANMPGGSWWLRSLAAVTLAEGGDRRSSRRMWQQILQSADHDWLRDNARLKLAQLDAADQMEELAGVLERWRLATGRVPDGWSVLAAGGWLRGVPLDPAGVPYRLDPAAPGGVALAPDSPLAPLPPQFTKKAGDAP